MRSQNLGYSMIDRVTNSKHYPTFVGWFVATIAIFCASCTIAGAGVIFVKLAGWLV
jgi:hypothetical protein